MSVFPVHFAGHLHDDLTLRVFYSACDAFVIPSCQDNLPNTGLEAHSAAPVVAFATGGLCDIVDDRVTEALADPLILLRLPQLFFGFLRIRNVIADYLLLLEYAQNVFGLLQESLSSIRIFIKMLLIADFYKLIICL